MTATTGHAPGTGGRTGGLLAAGKLAFATVATRGRLIASVLGVIFFIELALILKSSADLSPEEARGIAIGAYLLLLLPLMAVSNASIALGNAVQDSTLVYVWLRPISRWKLALAYVGASAASLAPMIVTFSLAMFAFGSSVQYVGALAFASLLTALAYAGPVVGLGVRYKRASMMALTYVILGETILGQVSGVARISVRNYGASLFAHLSGESAAEATSGRAFDPSAPVSIVVLLLFAAFGVALTTVFLKRADVA